MLVLVAFVEVPKADCHNRWTVGEHRADCKPLVLRTTFHGLEEGTVSALTKLEAVLTLRRNLPERHVYDQLSRHAAEHDETRLVEKLISRQENRTKLAHFDARTPRIWTFEVCLGELGFGERACKWVSIMLENTSATAAFNGWHSSSFPERSGVQQGSPLSPLLYVLAAQLLASHLRYQAQQGVIRPITMPDGQPAPVSHQHADDTTLHVLQPSDAQAALDSSIALFCAATCSQLNVSKSQGFLVQAQPLASPSVAALPSISFITGQQTIKHLGVLLGYNMQAASHQQFTGIYHAINAKVRHWAARGLSFLGRVHVAKQVLAASLWYHASFQRPSEQLLKQLSQKLRKFVASAQQASHSDDAVALAQDYSQGSAHLPCAGPGAALFPGKLTSSLPLCSKRVRPLLS